MIRKGLPFIIFIALTFLTISSIAQNENGWRISGLSLSHTSLNEFESNVPSIDLLDRWHKHGGLLSSDFSHLNNGAFGYSGNVVGGGHTYLHLLLTPRSKVLGMKPNNQSIQIGIGYGADLRQHRSFYEHDKKTIDTLNSDLGPIYVDSAYQNRLRVNHSYDRFSLDLQYQVSTDPLSRFNIYIAPALSFNYFSNRELKATYTEDWRKEYRADEIEFNRHEPPNREPTLIEKQEVALNDDYGFSAYLPVGIRWRVSKENRYINRLYLFTEGRIGLDYRSNPSFGNNLRSIAGITFGLRIWIPKAES